MQERTKGRDKPACSFAHCSPTQIGKTDRLYVGRHRPPSLPVWCGGKNHSSTLTQLVTVSFLPRSDTHSKHASNATQEGRAKTAIPRPDPNTQCSQHATHLPSAPTPTCRLHCINQHVSLSTGKARQGISLNGRTWRAPIVYCVSQWIEYRGRHVSQMQHVDGPRKKHTSQSASCKTHHRGCREDHTRA